MRKPLLALLASASSLAFLLPPAAALPSPSPAEVTAAPAPSSQPTAEATDSLELPTQQELPSELPAEPSTPPQKVTSAAAAETETGILVADVFASRYSVNETFYGKPVTSAQLANGITLQEFERSTFVYTPSFGAFPVYGAIRGPWKTAGSVNGWGIPTTDETLIAANQTTQNFTTNQGKSTTAYWSPQTGVRTVYNSGAIGNLYQRTGGYPIWGLPTTNERCGYIHQSCYQDFERATVIWSPAYGTHILYGAVRSRWQASGGMNSSWGIPTSDEVIVSDGDIQQNFITPQGKRGALYWTNHRGNTNYVNFDSGIGAYWIKEGSYQARGVNTPYRYGFPISEESCDSNGWCIQRFEYGQITWKNGIWVQDLADMLRAYTAPDGTKLKVVETNGWMVRGYEGKGFATTSGVLWHHTAAAESYFKNSNMPTLHTLIYGHSSLPGPLSQLGMGRDGTIYVIAAGFGNHAGYGRLGDIVDRGNHHLIGIEMESSGVRDDWTAAQRKAMPYVGAALELAYGSSAPFYQVSHKEYSTVGKIDPAYVDMNALRSNIQRLLGK